MSSARYGVLAGLLDVAFYGWRCRLIERIRPGHGHEPLPPQPTHCLHCGRRIPRKDHR